MISRIPETDLAQWWVLAKGRADTGQIPLYEWRQGWEKRSLSGSSGGLRYERVLRVWNSQITGGPKGWGGGRDGSLAKAGDIQSLAVSNA